MPSATDELARSINTKKGKMIEEITHERVLSLPILREQDARCNDCNNHWQTLYNSLQHEHTTLLLKHTNLLLTKDDLLDEIDYLKQQLKKKANEEEKTRGIWKNE
jgi:benzoyl-CoA reductase/2-hydroxyglutaryl-CoA dehydratase subunit BcrC/BadD/HgdB